jgi:DNA-binding LacI/PurR family transcriptional regulator
VTGNIHSCQDLNGLTPQVRDGHHRDVALPISARRRRGGGDEPAGGRSAQPAGSASIRDVAQRAGVSHQTVSRVINGHPYVKESTRQRVLEVIQDMAYRPSVTARALSRGASRAVTVLTSDLTRYSRAALLQGVEEAARAAGFSVEISTLDSPQPHEVARSVERVCDPRTGGIIVIADDLAGVRALRAVPAEVRVVAVLDETNAQDRRRNPSVVLDDQAAASAATRHLLSLGHQTVHYVAVPSSTRTSSRVRGWRAALRAAGAEVPRVVAAQWSPDSGYHAGRVLAADPRVTAALCGNDDLALGLIHALREAGRPVPDGVSVVGFGDTPQAAFYAPPLTTVRLDFAGLGRDCFELIRDPDASPTMASPELVIRASTGPPPRE